MGYNKVFSVIRRDTTPTNYFGYDPNLAAAIILCIAFGITFLIGLFNVLRHRKQIKGRFLGIFIFCPLAKCVGYALRSAASPQPTDFNLFISSQFFLFLTPQIVAAASYLTYAGLCFYVDEKFTLIKSRNVAIIFLGADALSTAIQGAGAGQLFGANANTWKIGAGICLAGMLAEFISFSAFSVVAIHFGHRYRHNKHTIPEPHVKIPIVDRILLALYINLTGQFIRAIFRVVEFSEWLNGVFVLAEVYLYIFDALPILACTLAFSILLPWELDYKQAVGDVMRKVEWGILLVVILPVQWYLRRRKERRAGNVELVEAPEVVQEELPDNAK